MTPGLTSGVIEINWGLISITGESDQRGGDVVTHIPLNLMFLSYFQYIEINAVIPVYTVQLLKQLRVLCELYFMLYQ